MYKLLPTIMIISFILALIGGFQLGILYQKQKTLNFIKQSLEIKNTGIVCINGRIFPEEGYEGFRCEEGFWRIRIPIKN